MAAFTTAWARLHLYSAVEKLDRRVLCMDTDSVVFDHYPGEWKPPLTSFLGDWTNEVPHNSHSVKFHTGGPKNYSCVTENLETGEQKAITKVKGIRLTNIVKQILNKRCK